MCVCVWRWPGLTVKGIMQHLAAAKQPGHIIWLVKRICLDGNQVLISDQFPMQLSTKDAHYDKSLGHPKHTCTQESLSPLGG